MNVDFFHVALNFVDFNCGYSKSPISIIELVECCVVAGRAKTCKSVFVGSKASGNRTQSVSDFTIISRFFSNAIHVYSLHSVERVAQWA